MAGYFSLGIYRGSFLMSIMFASVFLHQGCIVSGEEDGTLVESIFPTPLMRMVNASFAASLMDQTDMSSVVSNTSLADLINDNGTQQMQIRYRERKKQKQLLLIQSLILVKLGITRQPNVTSLSEEGRRRMLEWFNCTLSHEQEASDSSDSVDIVADAPSSPSCLNDGDSC